MEARSLWSLAATVAMLATVGCGPIHNQVRLPSNSEISISSIGLDLPHEGTFTVFYERATATTAPAAMFGLIGAAIASAANESADSKITKSLEQGLESASCSAEFKRSFLATLSEKSSIQVHSTNDEAAAVPTDATVRFDIKNCGFRVVDKERMFIAPFIEMYAKLTLNESGKIIWDDRETVIGSRRSSLQDLQSDGAMVQQAFEAVLKEAGQKMAYKISYL